jgi:hypothetical protein
MVTDLHDLPMEKLRKQTERKDGRSYISKDAAWMKERYKLGKGWYFEGCMSLVDNRRFFNPSHSWVYHRVNSPTALRTLLGASRSKSTSLTKSRPFVKLNNGKRNLIARIAACCR